jgi:hypothetical protein
MTLKRTRLYFWCIVALVFSVSSGYTWDEFLDQKANPLLINEFMAANASGPTDEDGDFSDWIEIYNRSSQPVNLSGWSLTNTPDQPDKWLFPDVTLASHDYLVVFASGKNRNSVKPGAALHTNFKLSRQGEYLALYNLLLDRPVDIISLQNEQFTDVAYGHAGDDLSYAYFTAPTPGEPNGQVLAWADNIAPASLNFAEQDLAQLPPADDLASIGPIFPLASNSSPAAEAAGSSLNDVQERVFGRASWTLPNSSITELVGQIRITEIMYNPPGGDNYEFIELKNAGSQPLNLASAFFEGINFTFPLDALPLGPGEFMVLVRNAEVFTKQYPGIPIGGVYEGHLSNQGEQLVLRDFMGNIIVSVMYDDTNYWPLSPDGLGDSLVLVNPTGDPNIPKNWRASPQLNGSPGQD